MILKTFKDLKSRYASLKPGDVYIGDLPGAAHKAALLLDLAERGVRCIPSPLAQILNTSKTAQAQILSDWMLPGTCVIYRRADLLKAAGRYHKDGVEAVVTKQDRMHCGHGIRRWESMENLYNVVSMLPSAYPFVLQPFLTRFTDVRVILVGDFVEAYSRTNPHNFRQNLAAGGTHRPFSLSKEMEAFCRAVMERGRFPYAHVDLQVVDETTVYLSEIALNGGIAGADIDRKALDQKKQALVEAVARASSLEGSPERIDCDG